MIMIAWFSMNFHEFVKIRGKLGWKENGWIAAHLPNLSLIARQARMQI
jgi:hypothetical protein